MTGGTNMIQEIIMQAMEYDQGDAKRIQHFLQVYNFAKMIAIGENLEENSRKILEIAAILHDIGIHESERIYNDTLGKHQEELGPAVAQQILDKFDLSKEEKERIIYLIAHHHTYKDINALDYQILVEADFLVNLYEDSADESTRQNVYDRIFKTATGRKLFKLNF
jgi:HD superfamily phosphodiesterase